MKRARVFIKCFLGICAVIVVFWAARVEVGDLTIPRVKSELIFSGDISDGSRVHASTIAETPSGFVVAWYKRDLGAKEEVFFSRLELSSRAWTAPEKVETEIKEDAPGSWNPVLFQKKNGDLFLFYNIAEEGKSWQGYFKISLDGGRTWGKVTRLPDGIIGPTKNKPIELEDGTILCPASTESSDGMSIYIEIIRIKETDGLSLIKKGLRIGPLNDGSMQVIQPTLLNFGKGKILLLARNKKMSHFLSRRIMQARSVDGGITWSKLEPSGLRNPNSGIDALTLNDGRCILVYNPSSIMRTPLEVAVSADEGRTWKARLVLENGFGEYSYPSVIQASDGKIHIVYTWNKRKIKHAVIDPSLIR